MQIKKEELIDQLKCVGYNGNVIYGKTINGGDKDKFLEITISKKGNKSIIEQLYAIGWSKIWEGKIADSFKYAGYGMYMNLRKYY